MTIDDAPEDPFDCSHTQAEKASKKTALKKAAEAEKSAKK
jgi:hypothetical protein